MEFAAFVLAALGWGWGAWRDHQNRKDNRANAARVTTLEEGKLDLSVAEAGGQIMLGVATALRNEINSLHDEINECHEERDQFHAILKAHGLLPK